MPTDSVINTDRVSALPNSVLDRRHGRKKAAIAIALAFALLAGCSQAKNATSTTSAPTVDSPPTTTTTDIDAPITPPDGPTVASITAGSPVPPAPTVQSQNEPAPSGAAGDMPMSAADNQTPQDDPGQQNPLDASSIAWFDTFCTGLAPIATLDNATATEAAGGDITETLTTLSDTFTRTAEALKAVPPPEFPGGSTLAAQLTSTLTSYGHTFAQSATDIAAANPSDPTAIESAMEIVGDTGVGGLKLDQLNIPAETRASIGLIQSCAALQF